MPKFKMTPGGALLNGTHCDHLLKAVCDTYRPKSVLDVGCGPLAAVDYFIRAGVPNVLGLDSDRSLLTNEAAKPRLDHLLLADIEETPVLLPGRFDLVWSFECAEHIANASNFVQTVCGNAARIIVMTAAAPGQSGFHHVNCRPISYWVKLIEEQGFIYHLAETEQLKTANRLDSYNHNWFAENGMVFHRVTSS